MITFDFDFSALSGKLDGITKAVDEGIRPAAQAGAQVFYEEARSRAPVGTKPEHYFYGTAAKKAPKGSKKALAYKFNRGNLKKSIYQFYNKRLSTPKRAVYSISWNHQEAPYGAMVEYGTSNAPAQPFLRPAFDAVNDRAQKVVDSYIAFFVREATK
jgi:HK97 gp10 family phage protein